MKMKAVTGAVAMSVLLVTLSTGCSRERIDWKSAESADTLESYDRFVERHPDSPLATQAHARMTQLVEDRDWKSASTTDTAEAYKQFLAQHASGKWAEEARIRIENFTLETNPSPLATPSGDTEATTPAAPALPAKPAAGSSVPPPQSPTKPTSAPVTATAPPASPQPATVGGAPKAAVVVAPKPAAAGGAEAATASAGFGIQLGAFGTQAAALAAWKKLQVTHDSELHGMFAHAVPVQSASGQLFRLQSIVGDESRARSICSALAKRSQPCVVVLPQVK